MLIWNQTVANKVTLRTKELELSREALRNLIDSLPGGIIVYSGDNKVQASNKVMADLLAVDLDFLIGKSIHEIEVLSPFLAHLNDPSSFPYNGKYYLVQQQKLNNNSAENLLTIEDYTERHIHNSIHRQEAKMIAIGELSAGLAHEIRNPLGLIKSYIYVLNKRAEDEISNHAVKVINESVDRINRLIENLLGFSRLSADKAQLVNPEISVRSIVALVGKDLEKNNITVQVNCNFSSEVNINEDVLRLCIVNLINNSIDAFREKAEPLDSADAIDSQIIINVSLADNFITIDYRDNAGGIPPEYTESVFNPFFTIKANGTGLGLYILQSEVARVEGTTRMESIWGEGTNFIFTIPVEEAADNG